VSQVDGIGIVTSILSPFPPCILAIVFTTASNQIKSVLTAVLWWVLSFSPQWR